MKHIKTLKAAMSALCTLSILLGAVLTFTLFGVAAGEIPTDITEVTWSDYLYEGAAIALDQPITFTGASAEYQGSGRFSDTLFNGDITFPSANEAGLILFGDWNGVYFVPNGATASVKTAGSVSMSVDAFELQASTFGLTSFEDVRLNFKAALFGNTDGKAATMSVWINNIHAFTVDLTSKRDRINGNILPLQGDGATGGNPCIVPHAPTEPSEGGDEPADGEIPGGLTSVSWGDFAMANYWTGENFDVSGTYRGDQTTRLNNMLFEGYLTQSGGSQVNIFGPASNPNWGGIKFLNPTETQLSVQGSMAIPDWGFNVSAEAVGMDSFVDQEYFLQMSVQYVDRDGDGAADDLKLGMWINEINVLKADAANAKPADDGFCYFLDHTDHLVGCVQVYHPVGNSGTTLLRSRRAVPTDLTEVTWSDYTFHGAPLTMDQAINFTGGSLVYGGGDFHGKLFNGDLTFPSANDAGLILFGDWHGLYMIPNGAEMRLYKAGSIGYDFGERTLRAEAFGLTSFEDVRLNFKAALTKDAAGQTLMSVWFNDMHVLTTAVVSGESNVNGNILPMAGTGATGGIPSLIPHALATGGGGEEDDPLEELIPEPSATVTWTDFAANGTALTPGSYTGYKWGWVDGYDSLSGLRFEGKIKMGLDTAISYGGGDPSHHFYFHYKYDGKFYVYNNIGTLTMADGSEMTSTYLPSDLGITGNVEETVLTVKFQMWNVAADENSARIALWVNDLLIGVYDSTVTNTAGKVGTAIGLQFGTYELIVDKGPVAELPTDYTEITYGDFGAEDRVYTVDAGASFGKPFTTTKVGSWDKVILTFEKIKFAGDIELSFAGENEWLGFKIMVRDDQNMMIQSAHNLTLPRQTLDETIAGVDLVGGDAYKLQITTALKDATTLEIGLWFNGVLYNNEYFTADLSVKEPGSGSETVTLATNVIFGFCNVGDESGSVTLGDGGEVEKPPVPTGYTELTWRDFSGLEEKSYPAVAGNLAAKGTYGGSLDHTLFSGDVTFNGNMQIRYAGNDGWQGLIVALTDGHLWVYNSTFGTEYSEYYTASDFGLTSLVDTKFNLKISTDISDNGETYTFGVWVNDRMAGNYFSLAKGSSGVGSVIGLYDNGSGASVTLGTPGVTPPPSVEIPTPSTTLTWSDFANQGTPLANTTYEGYTYGWSALDSMEGVFFEGKIRMNNGSQISFGGKDPSHMVYLQLMNDGNLKIFNNVGTLTPADGSEMQSVYTPADLGITGAIADTTITLKYQIWNVASDNMSANVAVWINDTLLDVYDLTVTNASARIGDAIGLQFGTYTLESVGGTPTPDPDPDEPYEYEATVEIPTPDKTVTWQDFAIRNGSYMPSEGSPYATYGFADGSLNNVLFEGKLKFGTNTAVVYGGKDPSWNFHVEYVGGLLNVRNNVFTLSAPAGAVLKTSFTSADLGIEGAIGEQTLTLKLQMWDVSADATYGRIALWVNDKLLCIYDMNSQKPEEYILGNGLGVMYGPAVIGDPSETPDIGDLPTGPDVYTELTWESFGFEDGTYYADNKGGEIEYREWIEGGRYSGKIDGSKFIGYLTQSAGTQLRFGNTGNMWAGIIFEVGANGKLGVQGSLNAPGWGFVVDPSMVGLTTFADTEYKLAVSTAFVDADADGFKDDVMLGIWINDVMVAPLCAGSQAEENGYVYLYDVAVNFGAGLALYPVYENCPITLRSAEIADPPPPPPVEIVPPPSNLTNITINDFVGVRPGQIIGDAAGQLKELTSFDGTLFSVDLNLITSTPGEATYIRFGGKENGWEGFSLQTSSSGQLVFYNYLKGGSTLAFFDPAIAGVKFFEETFNVKVSFEFFEADGDGKKDDIKIGIYFNDALYNAEFLYVYDLAPEMTTYFLAYTDDAEAHPLWLDQLEPKVIDLSMFGFSEDYKSQFGPTSDKLTVDGVPLGSNYTPFSGDVVTFCFWALIPLLAMIATLAVLLALAKKKKQN